MYLNHTDLWFWQSRSSYGRNWWSSLYQYLPLEWKGIWLVPGGISKRYYQRIILPDRKKKVDSSLFFPLSKIGRLCVSYCRLPDFSLPFSKKGRLRAPKKRKIATNLPFLEKGWLFFRSGKNFWKKLNSIICSFSY